jgi:hypothetical protein
MPRNQKKNYSAGPIWDEEVKRWLAEVVYPDDSRRRRRFRRQRDAQIWWAAQRKAIEDGSWEVRDDGSSGIFEHQFIELLADAWLTELLASRRFPASAC